jgi:uroporphyrinogen-III synthase
MNETITILSTKVIRALLKKQLLEKNILVDEYDFIETVSVPDSISTPLFKKHPPHYIFTSKKAAECFSIFLKEKKLQLPAKYYAYCLNGETKKAVIKAGMRPTLTAPNSRQLAQMIYKKGISKKLIFFCSNLRRNDLPDFLSSMGIKIKEIVLYKTLLLPRHVVTNYKAILFFSPSAVQSFFMSNKLNPHARFFCIGKTTANTLKETVPIEKIIIADKPTQQDITKKVISYFTSKNIPYYLK